MSTNAAHLPKPRTVSITLTFDPARESPEEIIREILAGKSYRGVVMARRPDVVLKAPLLKHPRGRQEIVLTNVDIYRIDPGKAKIVFTGMRFDDWLNARFYAFQPFIIDQTLAVVPAWDKRKLPGKQVIRIQPSMAFGSGSHETTRMCLLGLKKFLRKGDRVLDVGTGSGILAVTAARLGAGHIDAVDIDPLAIQALKKNARINRVARKITIWNESLGRGVAEGPYELIIANINLELVRRYFGEMARRLQPAGLIILSGINSANQPKVKRLFARHHFVIKGTFSLNEWRAWVVNSRKIA